MKIFVIYFRLIGSLFFGAVIQPASVAGALPEFAYHPIHLQFTRADGQPVPGAQIYGFCPELNLIWPRRDHELKRHNDILWHESFLGRTDTNGQVKATLPPGKWGFFAVSKETGAQETVVAGWSDFRMRTPEETVRLISGGVKHWTLCSPEGAALAPKRIYLKPQGFPIWIAANLAREGKSPDIELSKGNVQVWAAGDAKPDHAGFALSFGSPNDQLADGKILAQEKPALLEFEGGGGTSALTWAREKSFGLDGSLALSLGAKVWLSPGFYTLGYRRPVATGFTGSFLGQSFLLQSGQYLAFNLASPLQAGLDQNRSKTEGSRVDKLTVQLYLTDRAGHLLSEVLDKHDEPVVFGATAVIEGKRWPAKEVRQPQESLVAEPDEESTINRVGRMMFIAKVATNSRAAVIWEFAGPPGVLPQTRLTADASITLASVSFKMDVPRVLERDAKNLLARAELTAVNLGQVAKRKRRHPVTTINIKPEMRGAVASPNGQSAFGTDLFFSDDPALRHDLVHELGHVFDFRHGGLHETVIEATRCYGVAQISQQPAKWLFLDRMNGLPRKELGHPNIGLYLYCFAQGGPNFLDFMSGHEPVVLKDLGKKGYTNDELTGALLNLALGRDITQICRAYGLKVTTERVASAVEAIGTLHR